MAYLMPIGSIVLNLGIPVANVPQLLFSNRIMTPSSIDGVSLVYFGLSYINEFWQALIFYALIFCLFISYGYPAPIKN